MNTDNHKASDRNKVIIAEIRKLLNELEGNVIDKNPIAELGETFYDWAEEFFSPASGRLDCYVPFHYALKECNIKLINPMSPASFLGRVRRYAQLKNMTLNPAELQNEAGRVIKKSYELNYNRRKGEWFVLNILKAQSMIYLHTPGDVFTERVYDPTGVSRDFESLEKEGLPRRN